MWKTCAFVLNIGSSLANTLQFTSVTTHPSIQYAGYIVILLHLLKYYSEDSIIIHKMLTTNTYLKLEGGGAYYTCKVIMLPISEKWQIRPEFSEVHLQYWLIHPSHRESTTRPTDGATKLTNKSPDEVPAINNRLTATQTKCNNLTRSLLNGHFFQCLVGHAYRSLTWGILYS